jgi:RNA polymerase sigma-70 factor (ECF subfamily)
MFGTARHILYAYLRRKVKRQIVDTDQEALADLLPGVSTAYAKHREQRILLEALRRLPLQYQVALELYYWEGLSGPELASALGVPEATMRGRIRRGSNRLREEVASLAESPGVAESTLGGLESWLAELRVACGQAAANNPE